MADGGIRNDQAQSEKRRSIAADDTVITLNGEIINASGHRDQLQRQYGILSICGMALTIDNAWVAFGTSLSISICEYWEPSCFLRPRCC